MTAGDVIVAARYELKDEDAGNYRWSDDALFRAATEALRHLQMLRPDLFLLENDTMAFVTDVADGAAVVPVHDTHKMPLAWMICATVLASDGDDAANATRGDGYMVRAMNALIGAGR